MLYGVVVLIVFLILLFLIPYIVQQIWNSVIIYVVKNRVNPMTYWQAFAFWLFIALLVTGLSIPFSMIGYMRF